MVDEADAVSFSSACHIREPNFVNLAKRCTIYNCLRTQTVFNPKKLVCTCSGTGRPQCANTLESSVRTSSSSNLRTLPDPPPLAAEVASSPAYSSDGLKEPPAPPPDSFLYSDKAGKVANQVKEETYNAFPTRSP